MGIVQVSLRSAGIMVIVSLHNALAWGWQTTSLTVKWVKLIPAGTPFNTVLTCMSPECSCLARSICVKVCSDDGG